MRLIDADSLHNKITEEFEYKFENTDIVEWRAWEIRRAIDGEPTIDAVPVIRCKDCKHCDTVTIFGKTTLYSCTRKNPAVDVLPSDYCSRGRRIDES